MTLGELFETEKLTQDVLVNCQEINEYYDSACGFVIDRWFRPVDSLTPKQYDWAHKILEDLTEKRIEGRL